MNTEPVVPFATEQKARHISIRAMVGVKRLITDCAQEIYSEIKCIKGHHIIGILMFWQLINIAVVAPLYCGAYLNLPIGEAYGSGWLYLPGIGILASVIISVIKSIWNEIKMRIPEK